MTSSEQVGDAINPAHYNRFPVEPILLAEQLNFCRGNVVKYVARAGQKPGSSELEDLRKAKWYLEREIERLTGHSWCPAYDNCECECHEREDGETDV